MAVAKRTRLCVFLNLELRISMPVTTLRRLVMICDYDRKLFSKKQFSGAVFLRFFLEDYLVIFWIYN